MFVLGIKVGILSNDTMATLDAKRYRSRAASAVAIIRMGDRLGT